MNEQITECVVCGSAQFELCDGHFFCLDCGTQSQDVREEEAEQDTGGSFVRSLKLSAKKIKSEFPEEGEGLENPLEKFQAVLIRQCQALIDLGFDPVFKDSVKMLWFLYLKEHGYAFSNQEDSKHVASAKSEVVVPAVPTENVEQDLPPKNGARKPTSAGSPKNGKRKLPVDKATPSQPNKRRKVSFKLEPDMTSPDDAHLFDLDKEEESGGAAVRQHSSSELYFARRQNKFKNRYTIDYMTLKNNVALLYLGLLYSRQNLLLSDFSRWTRSNVLPFHNLGTVFPRTMSAGCQFTRAFNPHALMSADRIYKTARLLYLRLPLPPLPSPCPVFTCHTLVDRLKLPGSFHSMVDKTLAVVYSPEFMQGCWRFDSTCICIIIMLLRLVYKLDDRYEFEQAASASPSTAVDSSAAATAAAVYVWEDWVQVFSNHLHQAMESGLPLTETEVSRTKDYRKYLKFCRVEIFTNTRPAPLRVNPYNPKHYLNISELFRKSRDKLSEVCEDESKEGIDEHTLRIKEEPDEATPNIPNTTERVCKNEPTSSCEFTHLQDSTHFTPRLIPLEAVLSDVSQFRTSYEVLPRTNKLEKMVGIDLSHSMQFLLSVCSELLDTDVEDLYRSLLMVEIRMLSAGPPAIGRVDPRLM